MFDDLGFPSGCLPLRLSANHRLTRPLPAASCQHAKSPTATQENNRNELSHSDTAYPTATFPPDSFGHKNFQMKNSHFFTPSQPFFSILAHRCNRFACLAGQSPFSFDSFRRQKNPRTKSPGIHDSLFRSLCALRPARPYRRSPLISLRARLFLPRLSPADRDDARYTPPRCSVHTAHTAAPPSGSS